MKDISLVGDKMTRNGRTMAKLKGCLFYIEIWSIIYNPVSRQVKFPNFGEQVGWEKNLKIDYSHFF